VNKGKLIVVSGPSGAGKSTICQRAITCSDCYLSISATTRKPRTDENGSDYLFLSREEFINKIHENEFLEYACVHGNYYGTLKKPVFEKINSGINVILEIDVQGSMQIKDIYADCEMIFVLPPSLEELKKRLSARKTETVEQYNMRLKNAVQEINMADKYDFLVINDEVDNAVEDIKDIIKIINKKIKYNMHFINLFLNEEESL
jgi:guanylate kinase